MTPPHCLAACSHDALDGTVDGGITDGDKGCPTVQTHTVPCTSGLSTPPPPPSPPLVPSDVKPVNRASCLLHNPALVEALHLLPGYTFLSCPPPPPSQISNRALCLRNHLALAGLLNRTLVVPSRPEEVNLNYNLEVSASTHPNW